MVVVQLVMMVTLVGVVWLGMMVALVVVVWLGGGGGGRQARGAPVTPGSRG